MKHVSELMQSADAVIEQDKPISAFLGLLDKQPIPGAVVTRNGQYAGMIDVFSLLKSRIDISTTKVSSMVESVPTLAPQDTITHAAQMFSQTPLRSLPVVSDKKVLGVVQQTDVQKALDVVTPTSSKVTLSTEDTLGVCIQALRNSKQYAVAVEQEDIPVGVVTLKRVLERYYSQHQTRDQGLRPNQQTKAFTAENSSIMDLPINSLMQDIDEHEKHLFVTNYMLKEAIADAPQREIQFVGLDSFNKPEQASIQDLFARLYDKLLVHERYELKVHIKTYHEAGTQRKISVHLHAKTVHGDHLEATADEWGLEEASRSAMDKLEWQLRKLYV